MIAADRGLTEVIKLLIQSPEIDVNFQDEEVILT
jgi:hypothetical protein